MPRDLTSVVIATRGEHLALSRIRASGRDQRPEAFHTDALGIVEIDADDRIAARVAFDLDDIDAAFAELDARYLAGEAAPHRAHMVRHRAGSTPRSTGTNYPDDAGLGEHRPPARNRFDARGHDRIHPCHMGPRAPDFSIYIETVHRLSDLGAVVTKLLKGPRRRASTPSGGVLDIMTVEGDLINRCEIFDEADLDAALARFDELSRPAPRLENAASQVNERFCAYFAARDWDAIAEILADDVFQRRSSSGRERRGPTRPRCRDREHASDRRLGVTISTSYAIATRGERLALSRVR